MNKLQKQDGFAAGGIMELMSYMIIAIFGILWFGRLIKPAWQVGWFVAQEYDQRMTYQAMNTFIEDIRTSTLQSISRPALTRADTVNFHNSWIPWFSIPRDGAADSAYACYYYDASTQSLVRLYYYAPATQPSNL